jgi:hypothetical protein
VIDEMWYRRWLWVRVWVGCGVWVLVCDEQQCWHLVCGLWVVGWVLGAGGWRLGGWGPGWKALQD